MAVQFWQLNLHHCYAASVDLQRRLAYDAVFVALLQEPYTWGGLATICPTSTVVFQADVTGSAPLQNRSAVVVSERLSAWKVPFFTDLDTVTIAYECDLGTIWCCSAYMP